MGILRAMCCSCWCYNMISFQQLKKNAIKVTLDAFRVSSDMRRFVSRRYERHTRACTYKVPDVSLFSRTVLYLRSCAHSLGVYKTYTALETYIGASIVSLVSVLGRFIKNTSFVWTKATQIPSHYLSHKSKKCLAQGGTKKIRRKKSFE